MANEFAITNRSSPVEYWAAYGATATLDGQAHAQAAYTAYGVYLAPNGSSVLSNSDRVLNANGLALSRVEEQDSSYALELEDAGKIIEIGKDRTPMVHYMWIEGTEIEGTFTLAINGNTTAAIDYDPDPGDLRDNIQAAVEALLNIGSGNVTSISGDGSESSPIEITYATDLGVVANIDINIEELSGIGLDAGAFPGFAHYVWLLGATTGTYKLVIGAHTSGAINAGDDATEVQAVLDAIGALDDKVTVSGGIVGGGSSVVEPFIITYDPSLGYIDVIEITDDGTNATAKAAGVRPIAFVTVELFIPTHAAVAFPKGTRIEVVQTGECQIQVIGPFDSTDGSVRTAASNRTAGLWSGAALYKRTASGSPNDWVLIGDLASS